MLSLPSRAGLCKSIFFLAGIALTAQLVPQDGLQEFNTRRWQGAFK